MPQVEELPVAEDGEEVPPVIENIKVEKIEGPKVLGKIDLPVDSDTRPKKEEKRKRKRIPIEKKEQDNQEDADGAGEVSLVYKYDLGPYSPILAAIRIT